MKVVKLDTVLWVNRWGELLRRKSHVEVELLTGLFDLRLKADVEGVVRGEPAQEAAEGRLLVWQPLLMLRPQHGYIRGRDLHGQISPAVL